MSLEIAQSFHELVNKARDAEIEDKPEQALQLYRKALKQDKGNIAVYERMMVLLRKQKKYEEELKLITEAIKQVEAINEDRTSKILSKHKKAIDLSNALARSLGQKDRKGKTIVFMHPIDKWMKRAETVEKKIGLQKKKKKK